MKAKGIFMYKSIVEREKGSFTDKETGDLVEYGSCYVLVCDEIKEDGKINERRFKIDKENSLLAGQFSTLDAYTKVEIEFDVVLYGGNARVTPVSFEVA